MVLLLGLGLLLAAGIWLPMKEWVGELLEWSRGLGAWGAPMVASLFIPASVLMLPGTPISLATGFVFDFPSALASVILFSNLGAQAAFGIGRGLFRRPIAAWVDRNPRRKAVEQAVSSQGFRLVLLLRLSPLIPFNALNYALSVSRVSFRAYALGTFLGMLPGTLLFLSVASALGRAGSEWSEAQVDTGTSGNLLLWFGVASAFVAVGLVTKRARALLAKELA